MPRVIGMAFTNIARGDKRFNNAIGGIGARSRAVRRTIQRRAGPRKYCCIIKFV